jgi:tRNA modification GTPase
MAAIEVNIDYPEYEDIEKVTVEQIKNFIIEIKAQLQNILLSCENSKLIKEGINTVILGRPNVGKSSILNALLEEEKAIVTDIAGTTRDIVEGSINVDGFILNIMDTAGIRETENQVEAIGVKKSLSLIDEADLILFILNNNEPITEEDLNILDKIKDKNYLLIINKIDLESKININLLKGPIVYLSALTNQGIESLKNKIKEILNLDNIETKDLTYLTNAVSISLIKQSLETITSLENSLNVYMPIDLMEIDIRSIYDNLSKILGETYDDDVINQLFSQFCLGK